MFCISDDVRWPILNLHCLLLFHFDEPNWISKKDFFVSGGVPKRQTLKGGSLGDFGRPGYWRTKVTSGPSSRWLVEGAETCLFFLSSVFFQDERWRGIPQYVEIYIYIYICIYTCFIYIYIWMCVCVCYIYIYMHYIIWQPPKTGWFSRSNC